jgi:hypothetical protein
MRYYLVFLAMFLVACGSSDLLPEADILGPDAAVSDLSGSDTALRRDIPAEDWGQPDEGGDEGVDLIPDEGQDVTDAQEDAGEDVPAADIPVEDPGADEGEDVAEDVPVDAGSDEGADVEDGKPCSWLLNVCWRTTQCVDPEHPECFEEDCVAPLSDDATAAWRAIEDCTAAYCAKHPYSACRGEAWNYDCAPLLQSCLADVD